MQPRKRKKISEPICIVSVVNNNYVQHLAVTFASLLMNNPRETFKLFVISDELTNENKKKLSGTVYQFGSNINFLSAGKCNRELSDYNINHPAYLRIFMPQLLPLEVEKVIYLDCDVIVEEAITDLWNIDVSDYHVGAVLDTSMIDHLKCLIGKAGLPYFNSGVMLVNLRKWREDNTLNILVDFIRSNHEKFLYNDQDALNAILYDKWLKIDATFNIQTPMLSNDYFRDVLDMPHIIHYTGRGKPWDYINLHPFKNNYYKYLKFTPWRDFKPKITSQNIFDIAGLSFKKLSPSFFAIIRKFLIRRAMSGSVVCSRICKFFYIELYLE